MSMLHILLLGLALNFPAETPGPAGVGACPADNADARSRVNRFMLSSTFAGERQKYGIPSVASPTIRVLADAQDAATCQRFAEMVKPHPGKYPTTTVYYESQGFYFVSTVRVLPPNDPYIGFTSLHVFRGDFSYVHSYAM